MKIQDIIEKKGILIDIKAADKTELLTRMCYFLASTYDLKGADQIVQKIIERESAMSTGIGFGIAIPHARLDTIERVYMIAAKCAVGIEFDAIDDKPVNLIFIIVSPVNTSTAHTQVLSSLSKIMCSENMRKKLLNCRDAEEFLTVLVEGENRYVN
ncbi:MAG: PTS sugar transporter subunit IIA [Fibrobacterota bacterium]